MTLARPHPIWWEIIRAAALRTRVYRMGLLMGLISMALQLFSPYFTYTFLATGILILSALVGAVVLAKK